jgi:predicted HAD superfamily Cof-like phosphohydrolase
MKCGDYSFGTYPRPTLTPQEMVREFAAMLGAPVAPAEPALRDAKLRARLIAEEAAETVAALVGKSAAWPILDEFARKKTAPWDVEQEPDIVEAVDGVCDLIYVALGTAEAIGVDLGPFFAEVHRTNMLKKAEPIDAHGKKGLKPEGWEKPRIAALLEEARAKWVASLPGSSPDGGRL